MTNIIQFPIIKRPEPKQTQPVEPSYVCSTCGAIGQMEFKAFTVESIEELRELLGATDGA